MASTLLYGVLGSPSHLYEHSDQSKLAAMFKQERVVKPLKQHVQKLFDVPK